MKDLSAGVDYLMKQEGVNAGKVDLVSQMATTEAAILGQYGANDAHVNGSIPAMEQVLKDVGKTFEKNTYDGAGHAFNNDTGANYNEAAAVKAWPATRDGLKSHL